MRLRRHKEILDSQLTTAPGGRVWVREDATASTQAVDQATDLATRGYEIHGRIHDKQVNKTARRFWWRGWAFGVVSAWLGYSIHLWFPL